MYGGCELALWFASAVRVRRQCDNTCPRRSKIVRTAQRALQLNGGKRPIPNAPGLAYYDKLCNLRTSGRFSLSSRSRIKHLNFDILGSISDFNFVVD